MGALRPFGIGLAVGLVVGVIGATWLTTARLTPRMEARKASIDSLTGVVGTLREDLYRKVVQLDTVEIPRWRTNMDTLTITDTLRVREVLAGADSVITSCRQTVTACQRLAATERQRADSLGAQLADALHLKPRFTKAIYGATDTRGGLYVGAEVRARVFGLEGFGRYEVRLDSTATALRVGAVIPF